MGHGILLFFLFFSTILKVLKKKKKPICLWDIQKQGQSDLASSSGLPTLGLDQSCHSLGLSTLALQGKVCVCVWLLTDAGGRGDAVGTSCE